MDSAPAYSTLLDTYVQHSNQDHDSDSNVGTEDLAQGIEVRSILQYSASYRGGLCTGDLDIPRAGKVRCRIFVSEATSPRCL